MNISEIKHNMGDLIKKLNGNELKVYIALVIEAPEVNIPFKLTKDEIASRSGVSDSTIKRTLQSLEDKHFIDMKTVKQRNYFSIAR